MPPRSRTMGHMSVVPRILHWWWDGPPVPQEYLRFQDRWSELHPGWMLEVWDEPRFEYEFKLSSDAGRLYRHRARWSPRAHEWGWKTNIARYAILERHGGLWVDADLEPLKAVDPLVERLEQPGVDVDALAAYEDRKHINNAFLASAPGGRFISTVVAGLDARIKATRGKPSNVMTGPHYLTELAATHPELLVLDRALIYPMHWSELGRRNEQYPDAYTLHHWHRKSTETSRAGHSTSAAQSTLTRPGRRPAAAHRAQLGPSANPASTPAPPPAPLQIGRKMTTVTNIPPRIRKLAGLTPEPVAIALADLAAQVPKSRAIVELGVYQGRTALFMAWGARQGGQAHVYAVDPWDLPGERGPYRQNKDGALGKHRKAFTDPGTRAWARYNVKALGYANRVSLIRNFSVRAAGKWSGGPVGLLFVDGDHNYEAVRADVTAWTPHLAEDAVIAFDDYAATHPEVIQAVDDMVAEGVLDPVQVFHDRLAVTRLGSGNPQLVHLEQMAQEARRELAEAIEGDSTEREHPGIDWSELERGRMPEFQQAEKARQELERVAWAEADISVPRGGIRFPETAELPPAEAPPETISDDSGSAPTVTDIQLSPGVQVPADHPWAEHVAPDFVAPAAEENGTEVIKEWRNQPIVDVPLPDTAPPAAEDLPLSEWAVPGELGLGKAVRLERLSIGQLKALAKQRGVVLGREGKTKPVALAKLRKAANA